MDCRSAASLALQLFWVRLVTLVTTPSLEDNARVCPPSYAAYSSLNDLSLTRIL